MGFFSQLLWFDEWLNMYWLDKNIWKLAKRKIDIYILSFVWYLSSFWFCNSFSPFLLLKPKLALMLFFYFFIFFAWFAVHERIQAKVERRWWPQRTLGSSPQRTGRKVEKHVRASCCIEMDVLITLSLHANITEFSTFYTYSLTNKHAKVSFYHI